MAEKTIVLARPIQGHGRTHDSVRLREPTAREFFELGQPQSPVYAKSAFTMSDNDTTIAEYVRRCIVEPVADVVLAQVSLADSMRIREAVLDFFTEASQTAKGAPGSSAAIS